jgi:hypothetical protein
VTSSILSAGGCEVVFSAGYGRRSVVKERDGCALLSVGRRGAKPGCVSVKERMKRLSVLFAQLWQDMVVRLSWTKKCCSPRSSRNFEHGLPMQTPHDPPFAKTSMNNDDYYFLVVPQLGCDGLFKQLMGCSSYLLSLILLQQCYSTDDAQYVVSPQPYDAPHT